MYRICKYDGSIIALIIRIGLPKKLGLDKYSQYS